MTLLSVFGGGLFIIPLILLGASAYSFYQAVKQRNSGMAGWIVAKDGTKEWKESDEKLSFVEIGAFWFGVILLAACIVTVILMISDK